MSALERAIPTAVGVAVIVTFAVTTPRQASACSCGRRNTPQLYVGDEGALPRDARGIPWTNLARADIVRVERRRGAAVIEVPYTIDRPGHFVLIVPEGGLLEDADYTVVRRDPSETSTVTIHGDMIDLEAVRLSLGPRRRDSVKLVPRAPAGQCSDRAEADVLDAEARLPPALERYREYLVYEFIVDGALYDPPTSSLCRQGWRTPGRSHRARAGGEKLFSTCAEGIGLAAGTHSVALAISTPDGRRHVTAPQTFELDCETSPPAEEVIAAAPVEPPEPAPAADEASPSAGPPPVSAAGCRLGGRAPPWLLFVLLVARRRNPSSGRSSG